MIKKKLTYLCSYLYWRHFLCVIFKSLQPPTLHSHRHKAANTPLILICLKEERGEEFKPSFLYATNKITLLLLRHMQKYEKPLRFLTELSLFTTSTVIAVCLVILYSGAWAGILPDADLQMGSLSSPFPG